MITAYVENVKLALFLVRLMISVLCLQFSQLTLKQVILFSRGRDGFKSTTIARILGMLLYNAKGANSITFYMTLNAMPHDHENKAEPTSFLFERN
jgi:hypothetical protein